MRWFDNSYTCGWLVKVQADKDFSSVRWSKVPRQHASCYLNSDSSPSGAVGRLGPTLWITAWLFDPQLPVAEAQPKSAEAESWLSQSWRWIGNFLPDRYLDLHDEMLLKETPAPEVLHALQRDIPEIVDRGGGDDKNPQRCRKPDGTPSDRFECAAVLGDWLRKVVPLKLQKRDLRGANLYGAVLPISDLWEAQLQGADLDVAQLQGASLGDAQLQGASLGDAQLQGASLSDAQLQGASLTALINRPRHNTRNARTSADNQFQ